MKPGAIHTEEMNNCNYSSMIALHVKKLGSSIKSRSRYGDLKNKTITKKFMVDFIKNIGNQQCQNI